MDDIIIWFWPKWSPLICCLLLPTLSARISDDGYYPIYADIDSSHWWYQIQMLYQPILDIDPIPSGANCAEPISSCPSGNLDTKWEIHTPYPKDFFSFYQFHGHLRRIPIIGALRPAIDAGNYLCYFDFATNGYEWCSSRQLLALQFVGFAALWLDTWWLVIPFWAT